MYCLLAILTSAVLNPASLTARDEALVIEGSVRDAETDEPIAGASIRVVGTRLGSYSLPDGAFRLPLPKGSRQLRISSLGYLARDTVLSPNSATLVIKLRPRSIKMNQVVVTAAIDAEEVIRRAVARKEENRARLKTLNGLLYSKLVFSLDGQMFGAIEDKDRQQIRETFSRVYLDNEREKLQIDIVQRRQTANVNPSQNLTAITNFFSFYDDKLVFNNAEMTTPLSRDALDDYKFTLRDRQDNRGRTAFVLDFEPRSDLFPGFIGTMTIIDSSYNLIEIDARPSDATAIRYVHDLNFIQKFDEVEKDIWIPTYLHTSGSGGVTVLAGIAEVEADVSATSFYSELEINKALPDSVYDKPLVSVDASADSSRPEFWEQNSRTRLSDYEKRVYHRSDSLTRAAKIEAGEPLEESLLSMDWQPSLLFNRVSSIMPGIGLDVHYDPLRLSAEAFYSFGQKRGFADALLSTRLWWNEDGNLWLKAGAFARLASNPDTHEFFVDGNSLVAALFNKDHFDYYRADGWLLGLSGSFDRLTADLEFRSERHFALANTTSRGIFAGNRFRGNPAIEGGEYNTAKAVLQWGFYDVNVEMSSRVTTDLRAKVTGLYGERPDGGSFSALEGKLRATIPTFASGYVPMTLKLAAEAGIGSDKLPTQYQFVMAKKLRFFGRSDQFFTPAAGLFGGTQYLALHAEHNFSDLLWRWLGLPLFEKRGIEFMLNGSAAYYDQMADAGYLSTNNDWYTELGFGIGKIPIIISNVFFLRFDAAWGIGPLADGAFGYTISLSSPF